MDHSEKSLISEKVKAVVKSSKGGDNPFSMTEMIELDQLTEKRPYSRIKMTETSEEAIDAIEVNTSHLLTS